MIAPSPQGGTTWKHNTLRYHRVFAIMKQKKIESAPAPTELPAGGTQRDTPARRRDAPRDHLPAGETHRGTTATA